MTTNQGCDQSDTISEYSDMQIQEQKIGGSPGNDSSKRIKQCEMPYSSTLSICLNTKKNEFDS